MTENNFSAHVALTWELFGARSSLQVCPRSWGFCFIFFLSCLSPFKGSEIPAGHRNSLPSSWLPRAGKEAKQGGPDGARGPAWCPGPKRGQHHRAGGKATASIFCVCQPLASDCLRECSCDLAGSCRLPELWGLASHLPFPMHCNE